MERLRRIRVLYEWEATLRFVLENTDKRVLFTAHSASDERRDRGVLEGMVRRGQGNGDGGGEEEELRYKPNPFTSRQRYKDPFPSAKEGDKSGMAEKKEDSVHLVSPNHSFLIY